uniref:Uncharacterized protein n=1 Tax=Panagrolaimus davidi TaxID=227884 RepID=A0A914QVX5_9BILA
MGAFFSFFASYVVPTYSGKLSPSKKQDWGYPESMIHYIAKNPSSVNVYQKIIQSCKYFFEKNPVLVASKLVACEENFEGDICLNKTDECRKNKGKCCVKIDIAKDARKIWLLEGLQIGGGTKISISVLCSQLYRCEINCLEIWNKEIMFDDLKLLTSSAKKITLCRSSVKYNDGKPVMLDKIIESSSNGTEFFFEYNNDDVSMVNVSTLKNIMKLKNLKMLERFNLVNLPELVSIEDISAFFKHAMVAFGFNENISENYKNQLDSLVDEIIESEVRNHIIEYHGQDEEKLAVLFSQCYF